MSEDKPLVSVICPTYNQESFVEEALLSVLEQDYENLQLLVSDDCSADQTLKLIKNLETRYPSSRLLNITDGKHRGITENCNHCLSYSTGKYVAFFAGDDIFLPGKISRQVEFMEKNPELAFSGHEVEVFNSESGKTLYLWSQHRKMPQMAGAEYLLEHGMPYGGVSLMARRELIPQGGYDKRLGNVSDLKFFIDILANGNVCDYFPAVYARYRRHENSITAISAKESWDDQFLAIDIVENEYPALKPYCKKAKARTHHECGIINLLKGKRQVARAELISSLRLCGAPKVKTVLGLILSLFPSKALLGYLRRLGVIKVIA